MPFIHITKSAFYNKLSSCSFVFGIFPDQLSSFQWPRKLTIVFNVLTTWHFSFSDFDIFLIFAKHEFSLCYLKRERKSVFEDLLFRLIQIEESARYLLFLKYVGIFENDLIIWLSATIWSWCKDTDYFLKV